MPDPAFVEELHQLNGTPEEVLRNAEMMELLPILRAYVAVSESFVQMPDAPLTYPISALGGLQDKVSQDQLAPCRDQTSATFTLHMFPGNHFFLHSAQALVTQAMAQDIAWVPVKTWSA